MSLENENERSRQRQKCDMRRTAGNPQEVEEEEERRKME
jgi:hypothetical protein